MNLPEGLALGQKEMVCFVGAGGKSTIMSKLARQLALSGRSVLVTTSTKMYRGQLDFAPEGITILEKSIEELFFKLISVRRKTNFVSAAHEVNCEGKVEGLSKDDLNALFLSNLFDYILVEADGARGKTFKAPGDNEPVIPKLCSMVVPVAGIDIVGAPLTAAYVHRPENLASVTAQRLGSCINCLTVAKVITIYSSLAESAAPGCRVIPILNKTDSMKNINHSLFVARDLLHLNMPRVVVSSFAADKEFLEVVL